MTQQVARLDGSLAAHSLTRVPDDADPVLPPWMAGPRVGLSPSTLAKMRMDGRGPRFIKLSANRVGYRLSALNEWLEARERGSTLDEKRGEVPA